RRAHGHVSRAVRRDAAPARARARSARAPAPARRRRAQPSDPDRPERLDRLRGMRAPGRAHRGGRGRRGAIGRDRGCPARCGRSRQSRPGGPVPGARVGGPSTRENPKAVNALDAATLRELARAIRELRRDGGVRALVVTGAGDKAFSAGADIAAMAAMSAADGHAYSRLGHEVLARLEALAIPVVAAVN